MKCDMVANLEWGTVRDICAFTVLFSVSRLFLFFVVSDVFMKSTLFWVITEHGSFSCLIRTILLLFTDITFIIYLRPIFLPGDCRSFTSKKNTLILPVDTCRPPEWVLAPSAEAVITFGDLALVCRFGKCKFSLTFSCCASPLSPFSLIVLCDTP